MLPDRLASAGTASPECCLAPGGCPSNSRIKETAHMRYLPSLAALAALISSALVLGGLELLAVGPRRLPRGARRWGAPRGSRSPFGGGGGRAARLRSPIDGPDRTPLPPPRRSLRPRSADARLRHGRARRRAATGPRRRSAPSRSRASSARRPPTSRPQAPLTQAALADAIRATDDAPARAEPAAPTRADAEAALVSSIAPNATIGGARAVAGRRAGPGRRPRRLRARRQDAHDGAVRSL